MLVIYYGKESAGDEFFKDFEEDGKKAYRAVGWGGIGGLPGLRMRMIWEVAEVK
jgi:hypothetical protein